MVACSMKWECLIPVWELNIFYVKLSEYVLFQIRVHLENLMHFKKPQIFFYILSSLAFTGDLLKFLTDLKILKFLSKILFVHYLWNISKKNCTSILRWSVSRFGENMLTKIKINLNFAENIPKYMFIRKIRAYYNPFKATR